MRSSRLSGLHMQLGKIFHIIRPCRAAGEAIPMAFRILWNIEHAPARCHAGRPFLQASSPLTAVLHVLFFLHRSYLFLGGYLSSAILGFMALRLVGWITGIGAIAYSIELYLGLLVFSGYVLFDTQLIVERASAGDFDHVKHALDLFVDFVAILVRVVIILMRNQERRDSNERKDKRRRA